jgi:hypothetical protein
LRSQEFNEEGTEITSDWRKVFKDSTTDKKELGKIMQFAQFKLEEVK